MPSHRPPNSLTLWAEHAAGRVVDVVIERPAVVGHLPLAVAALRRPQQAAADSLAGDRATPGEHRRPCARAVAVALALRRLLAIKQIRGLAAAVADNRAELAVDRLDADAAPTRPVLRVASTRTAALVPNTRHSSVMRPGGLGERVMRNGRAHSRSSADQGSRHTAIHPTGCCASRRDLLGRPLGARLASVPGCLTLDYRDACRRARGGCR